MNKENEVRLIAYALWAQDGYNRRSAVRHWLQAEAIWQQNRQGSTWLPAAFPDRSETQPQIHTHYSLPCGSPRSPHPLEPCGTLA